MYVAGEYSDCINMRAEAPRLLRHSLHWRTRSDDTSD